MSEYDLTAIRHDAERAARLHQTPAMACPWSHLDFPDRHRWWVKNYDLEIASMTAREVDE